MTGPLWSIVPVSVTGPDHLATGQENQDAHAYRRHGDAYVVAVPDGAGSRNRSATGARLAVEAACDTAAALLDGGPVQWDAWQAAGREWAGNCLRVFDARIGALARTGPLTRRADYATTLLAVAARPPRYYYLTVGDGFLVVAHRDSGPHLVLDPAPASDRGATYFLTSKDRDLRQEPFEDPAVTGLALCTDGLTEALLGGYRGCEGGLRYLAPPEFQGYFDAFAGGTVDAATLCDRLRSKDMAATSGDDKTMLLVVCR